MLANVILLAGWVVFKASKIPYPASVVGLPDKLLKLPLVATGERIDKLAFSPSSLLIFVEVHVLVLKT